MQCWLYFFNNNKWQGIEEHLKYIPEPYQIITNSYSLNEYLVKTNKKSSTLREIFPEEGEITHDTYRRTKKTQSEYESNFKNITFRGFEIFPGFENKLQDYIILFEKARKILEEKKNTVFIFEEFYFTYFAIMKLAKEMGYDTADMSISFIDGNKIKRILPEDDQTILNFKNRYYYLKSVYFPDFSFRKLVKTPVLEIFTKLISFKSKSNLHLPTFTFFTIIRNGKTITIMINLEFIPSINNIVKLKVKRTYDKLAYYRAILRLARINHMLSIPNLFHAVYRLIFKTKQKRVHKRQISTIAKISIRLIVFLIQLLFFRTLTIMNIQTGKIVTNRVNSKILGTDTKYDAECAFVFTTNPEDLYLKSLYPILDKCKKEKIKYQIFVIDVATATVLSKKGITFVNLFEEVNILTDVMKLGFEGNQLNKKIIDVASRNNLSLLYMNQLNPQLLNEIHRSASIMTIFEYILEQMKPKSIVVATDGSMFGNSVISVSRKYKIPTFFVPSAHINLNPLHAGLFKSDKICVYGLQGIDVLTELGYERERLILTGSPKYDYLKSTNQIRARKTLENAYQIDREKKLIVIGMARWHENDEIWMSNLIKFCNSNNIEIMIKIHPTYKSPGWFEESESKVRTISERCKDLKYLILYDADLKILLSGSDLVITEYSNVGAEAILMDKPLLVVNFIKERLANKDFEIFSDASIYLEEYDKMESLILDMLFQNKYMQELKEGRKKINDRWNIYNDGKATERVFNLLLGKNEQQMIPAK